MTPDEILDTTARIIIIIGPAVYAGWLFYTKVIAPAKLKASDETRTAQISADADTREYEQETNKGALNQVIVLNENLVKFLIDRYDKLVTTINVIPKIIGDAKTQIEISNRDRVRSEEIIADIDIMLHEIKARQDTIIELLSKLNINNE